jgi:hypothetical protein
MTSWSKMIPHPFRVETKSEIKPNSEQTCHVGQKYYSITRDDVTVIVPTLRARIFVLPAEV